jgi:hypothetical protein
VTRRAAATTKAVITTVIKKKTSSVRVVVSGKTKHPKLAVRVKSAARVTGTVSVFLGKRVLAKSVKLKGGKAVITIKKSLKVSRNRLVVKYAGTKTVKASSTAVAVRVKR